MKSDIFSLKCQICDVMQLYSYSLLDSITFFSLVLWKRLGMHRSYHRLYSLGKLAE
jgi:hypothetical protein